MRNKFLIINILMLIYMFGRITNAQQISVPIGFKPASDSLKGNLWPSRNCFDALHYSLFLDIDTYTHTIFGHVRMRAKLISKSKIIQLDLAHQLMIGSIINLSDSAILSFYRIENAVFVNLPDNILLNQTFELQINYHGKPVSAANPPWQGGFVWQKDRLGRPWVGVACQGLGASSWWPCKDHPSDEPDSAKMSFASDSGLICISNGRQTQTAQDQNHKTRYNFLVLNPINLYNITLNIGYYKTIQSNYISVSETNPLRLNFYVLDYNLRKAKRHFEQVNQMLECYEKLFGNYPFWQDGYALVETHYLGMEHQSAISYGNKFKNNKFGFDFIIIHESGHEYWGNSLSIKDNADLWIHESFCTYSETLYLEQTKNKAFAIKYLRTQKSKIQNLYPIQGKYGVAYNDWPDADMYYKGAWMLHSLRNMIDNDSLFLATIKNLALHFRKSGVSRTEIIAFLNLQFGCNLDGFFAQHLDFARPAILEYKFGRYQNQTILEYRWAPDIVDNFPMPAQIFANTHIYTLLPTKNWQTIILESKSKKPITIWPTDKFYHLTQLYIEK